VGVFDVFKRKGGNGPKDQEIVGSIVEGPTPVKSDDSAPAVLVFRLDSRPDLEFRQVASPLAPKRRRGDRVKVHCRLNDGNVATVDWVEKAD